MVGKFIDSGEPPRLGTVIMTVSHERGGSHEDSALHESNAFLKYRKIKRIKVMHQTAYW